MIGLTGVTANTTRRRLLGEGASYINYGEVGERLLGAVTQGEFDPGITLAEGAVAGTLGSLKGMDYIESCKPTLQMTLLEITKENLEAALVGGAIAAPGVGSRTHQEAEWFGLGTGAVAIYPLEQDYVWDGTLLIWRDVGRGPVLLSEGALLDYTVNYATGVVTFTGNLPAATEGTSTSGLNPSIDMTATPLEVDAMVAVDGAAAVPVVFAWAGCNTGILVAAQLQAAIQALGGAFAAVTVTYNGAPPNDYYLITSGITGIASAFIVTTGGANSCTEELNLGVLDGGTEVPGDNAANVTADYEYDPGDGAVTHDVITANPIDEAVDYVTNVAWLGRCADQPAEEMIIVVKNALPIAFAPLTLEDKGAIGLQVTFRGSVTGAMPQVLPFEIRRPVPA